MHDELTEVDLRKMKEEIDYRRTVLRPKLIEDVQIARGFGDLSENFEYKCAKRDKNRNDSRIRYLEGMIRTAKVISADSSADTVGLFDRVEIFNEKLGKVPDHPRGDHPASGRAEGADQQGIPGGQGRARPPGGGARDGGGQPEMKFTVEIRSIEKGTDDDSLSISAY
jgi:transcription elongation factor GreA